MALMEVNLVAVDRALYERAKAGDAAAVMELKAAVNGLELYCHAMPVSPSEEVVNVYDLGEVLPGMTLTVGFDG